MIGKTLGSYRITSELGEGGMGVVYRAEHPLLEREAAIKMLLPEYSKDETVVARFFNEGRAASKIRHPGIIDVFDFGYADDGAAYIIMEFLPGDSLKARIRRRGCLTEPEVMLVARQAASALEAAHQAGIIHRDLKPDNIHLVPDPEAPGGERVKVLDFGIAKLTGNDVTGPVKTRTGSVMGSPRYMSPEQCRGAAELDARSDLYSLGCVIFEMATGRAPFDTPGVAEAIGQHLYVDPPTPRSIHPEVSAALEAVILRLLQKEPGDRYGSMAELVELLDELSDGAYATGAAMARFRTPPEGVPAIASGLDISAIATGQTLIPATEPEPDAALGTPVAAREASAPEAVSVTTLSGAASSAQVPATPPRRPARGVVPVAALALVLGGAALGISQLGDRAPNAQRAGAAAGAAPIPAAPPQVSFSIETQPAGAEVYRMPAQVRVGTTPYEADAAAVAGDAVFLVSLPGHRDERVTLSAARGGRVALTLEPEASAEVVKDPPRKQRRSRRRNKASRGPSARERPAASAPARGKTSAQDHEFGELL